MNRDVNGYISFLNSNDWSLFHRSQPSTWVDPFWPHQQISGDIADILDDTTGTELSGLDVYDPMFEEDLNAISDDSLSGTTEEGFGFVSDEQTPSDVQTSTDTDSKSSLLNLIKQRELQK